jgi:hypothetical protein
MAAVLKNESIGMSQLSAAGRQHGEAAMHPTAHGDEAELVDAHRKLTISAR